MDPLEGMDNAEIEPAADPVEPAAAAPEPVEPAAEPATPAEPIAAEPASEPAQEPPVTPAAAPVVPVTPPAQAAPVQQQQSPAPTAAQLRLQQIEQTMLADDFDGYTKEGRALQVEHGRIAAIVVAEPIQQQLHESTVWQNLADEHDLSTKELRAAWKTTESTIDPKYRNNQAVMDFAFGQELTRLKAAKAAPVTPAVVDPKNASTQPAADAPATPAPTQQYKPRATITARPGAISPPGAAPSHRPPAPKTPAEEFDSSVTREDLQAYAN